MGFYFSELKFPITEPSYDEAMEMVKPTRAATGRRTGRAEGFVA